MKFLQLLLLSLIGLAPAEQPPAVYLIGDSTMADKPTEENPERGWGQLFPKFFQAGVTIRNYAVNGRSTKSFINEHRWDTVVSQLKSGDWVLIQFGHNDSKVKDSTRYAAPRGDYKTNLERFVKEARAKGANPILITPVARRKFTNGKLEDTHGDYPAAVREVAKALNVPMIDLQQSSSAALSEAGEQGSVKFFKTTPAGHYKTLPKGVTDDTHFNTYGATKMAALVADAINKQNIPLENWLLQSDFTGKYAYELPVVYEPHFRRDTFSILQYGAKADGITLNSKSINDAITDCSSKGGGVVYVPNGLWLTGPIVLKSNVNLHLAANAVLQFTTDYDQYPLVKSTYEGLVAMRCQPPVSALDQENIAVTGKGILDGGGDAWRAVKKGKMTESQWKDLIKKGGVLNKDSTTWYPTQKHFAGTTVKDPGVITGDGKAADFEAYKDFLRPNMVSLTSCKNVLLEGVTFQNSPAWCIHPLLCENITLRNVYAKNPWYAQNGDGLDLESCSYAQILDCTFDVGDDGICIKSGRDEQGRKRGKPTENVVVNNCTVYHAHGGFVIGSEMSGGANNIYVSNSTFMGTDIGLRFKTTRGRGGVVENIYVSNINMREIPGEAILFDMYYAAKDPIPLAGENRSGPKIEHVPVTEATPVFRNFYIENVVCHGAKSAVFIRGLPEMPISNINMSNMTIKAKEGISCMEAKGIHFKDVYVVTSSGKEPVTKRNATDITFSDSKYKDTKQKSSVEHAL
ncbi:glycosyl hydrolase family 28 protein [Chitinophaga sp. sic0106]|uniref:glycosyl hydrolase family 28 protein n=1 Tax=Chitinophaga sp. sic0106 TaxID=2854785 RepID=UPI001C47FAE9|nr:glycosyl hydrolase family 28 protein [Chitinophaga sp. sic0106]MBV7530306.1 right-handed parallel beta-helix repeat-containing protein [Chitinophaga sp. sic0106]